MSPNFEFQSLKSGFIRPDFVFNQEVKDALNENRPVVALESTVISHGLPRPINYELAVELENIVRENDAVPAMIAVFGGVPHVGLTASQIQFLAESNEIVKLSTRDLPIALANKLNGATTVATTCFFANQVGIRVFATGGIGGVHRGSLPDVSADLPALAETPLAVVCAGAKSVLDLPATREYLETHGVTILGWQTDELPAFYARSSRLKVDARIETAEDAAAIIAARDHLNLKNAVLITVPVPVDSEIQPEIIEDFLNTALAEAEQSKITGKEITPFLLNRLAQQSGGATLNANLALLRQNARIAAQIAVALCN